MRIVLIAFGIALLLNSGMAHAQDTASDAKLPTDNWAYQALDRANTTPSPIRIRYGYDPKNAGMSRGEFAVAITRLLDSLPPAHRLASLPLPFQTRLYSLRRLVREFAPELAALGKPLTELSARLATPVPFSDVPQSHWAAFSVWRLQEAGMLTGYPNGEN